jgi:hypothetical protein
MNASISMIVSVGKQVDVIIYAFQSQTFTQSFTDFKMKAQTGHSSFRVKASYYESDQEDDPTLATQLAEDANKIEIIMGSPRSRSWIASEGQLTYTFATDSYTLGQIYVYVGGVPLLPDANFLEDSPTSFTLLCDVNEIFVGIEVVAIYR